MKFSGVTIDVQTQYPLDESFLTSSCEYEEWGYLQKSYAICCLSLHL